MSVTFERATEEDFSEIVDLGNYVFSHSHSSTDFPSLLPKLYKKEHKTAPFHFIAREDGKIKAQVGSFPMTLTILEEDLLVYGIGTVSVHPYARSSGYMKKLMEMAQEDMQNAGADAAFLGGQRQRYQYFGYDQCGQIIRFTIDTANVKHCYGKDFQPGLHFVEMKASSPYLEQCSRWFHSQPIHVLRESNRFYDILKNWKADAWAILNKDELIGYLCASSDGKFIHEIIIGKDELVISGDMSGCNADETLQDLTAADAEHTTCELPVFIKNPDLLPYIFASWLATRKINEVKHKAAIYDIKAVSGLMNICEEYSIEPVDNIAVYHFDHVVQAYLKLKMKYQPLPDGVLIVKIEDRHTIKITVVNKNVSVVKCNENPHLSLTYMNALAFFFGPIGSNGFPIFVNEKSIGPLGWAAEQTNLAMQWFPLSLHFDKQDGV